ncbi:LOW QUALITY PROTEIN: hypothetical protein MAR_026084 [Mya arenaria]|uniref:Uncharacterized protein n=1 Tax=Mya arenaria TaxID=6604 RepID=A0ABY7ESJ8_MYAAR|nr:LOW QUALITY PROTEIN: hypothetical protein MAR_026084 [Mya arenaria]
MDPDKVEQKFSVPTIRHEVSYDVKTDHEDHEEPTIADKNQLFQRRMELRDSEHVAQNHSNLKSNNTPWISFRNRPRPKYLNVGVGRPRRSSLPSTSGNFLSESFDDIHNQKESDQQPLRRVRSFKITSKGGIVNRGDSFKRSSNSINSIQSAIHSEHGGTRSYNNSMHTINRTQSRERGTLDSTGSSIETVIHKVAMVGDKGVGKHL